MRPNPKVRRAVVVIRGFFRGAGLAGDVFGHGDRKGFQLQPTTFAWKVTNAEEPLNHHSTHKDQRRPEQDRRNGVSGMPVYFSTRRGGRMLYPQDYYGSPDYFSGRYDAGALPVAAIMRASAAFPGICRPPVDVRSWRADFTSIAGCAVAVPFGLKISAAPFSRCAFHVVI